jgi:hypothetical protein
MVSFWRAEGDATDTVGGNNGVLQGGAGFAAGEVGQAFSFDGSSGHVLIPDSPSLDSFAGSMTMELWMKSATVGTNSDWVALVAKGDSSWRLLGTAGSGTISFLLNGTSVSTLTGNANVNDGNWHHITATFAASEMSLYVDGALDNQQPTGAWFVETSDPLEIGADSGVPSGYYFNGLIDEVSIYNRALSSAEIAAIYNAGKSGKCSAPLLPSIVTQPTNQTVAAGAATSFSVTASGSSPLSYQWWQGSNIISRGTNSTLYLSNLHASDSGGYYAVVSNGYGSTNSSAATLTVTNWLPTITRQPVSQTPFGGTVTFTVAATGVAGMLTYQWLCDGTNLLSGREGVIRTIAGNGTQGYSGDYYAATNASLNAPNALAADSAGNVFFMDSGNNRVRKVDTNGIITTVAGNGSSGFSGDGGWAIAASLSAPIRPIQSFGDAETPSGMAVDAAGNLFFSDSGNLRVRKVDTNGYITTVAGSGISSVPGTASGDGGWATNAPFGAPYGVAVDTAGNLFIADSVESRLQEVDTNGVMIRSAHASGGRRQHQRRAHSRPD